MATKQLEQTRDLVSATEEHGVTRVLNMYFRGLMSLGSTPTSDVCRLFRDFLMSNLGLNYLSKLNLLVENNLLASIAESRDDICRWIHSDVVEAINAFCESDVFDNPRTLSVLSDIVMALNSSLNMVDEETIAHAVDHILDMPYQLNDLVKRSSDVPWFYTRSFQREERGRSERTSFHVSERSVSISYKVNVTR